MIVGPSLLVAVLVCGRASPGLPDGAPVLAGPERPAAPASTWGTGTSLFVDVAGPEGLATHLSPTWGASWGDADGDGRLDILLVRHEVAPPSLFLNRGASFLELDDLFAPRLTDRHAAAWGDYDGDGDEDLFIATGAGEGGAVGLPAELYRNDGTRAADVAAAEGVDRPLCRGRGAAWLDADGDGDLDLLYLCGVTDVGAEPALFENRGPAGFVDVAAEAGLAIPMGWNGGIFPADYDGDGDLDLFLTAATITGSDRSLLLRNDGGRFTDVTIAAGIGPLRNGRGAAWGDFDGDGDLDLYVGRGANHRDIGPDGWSWSPDDLREVTFSLRPDGAADLADVVVLRTGSGALTFDFPGVPGLLDAPDRTSIHLGPTMVAPAQVPFTVAGQAVEGRPPADPARRSGVWIWTEQGAWYVARSRGDAPFAAGGRVRGATPFLSVADAGLEVPGEDRTNRLFRNDGDGTFTDVTDAAGVGCSYNTGPVIAGDFDNDGDLDLFALNGDHIRPTPSPWLAYRNDGGMRFRDLSHDLGLPARPLSRKAVAASADYDNDGDLDLWISNEIGPPPWFLGPFLLLRNQGTGNHGLDVRLVGRPGNRDGIGARVVLVSGGRAQVREATGGSSLASQNDPRLHFGLGARTRADRITVRWPSGTVQVVQDVPAGGVVTITEP